MFDRDRLNMVNMTHAARATVTVIDAIQALPPEEQIAGITAAFKLLTERFEVSPQDAFDVANNIMHHADGGRRVEFKAMRAYMEGEL